MASKFHKRQHMTFTTKNVQRAVREVKDTDRLRRWLGVPYEKRDEIERQFSTVPQQVKVYINYFMEHNPVASWRAVIVALDRMREKEAADAIRHLAEPVTDPTLTINNLRLVTASVKNWYDLGRCIGGLNVPDAVCKDIRGNTAYKTEEEEKEALLLYYLRTMPMASWPSVAGALHYRKEKTASQAVKIFLEHAPADSSLSSENLSTVLDSMRDDLWEWFSVYVNMPDSERGKIRVEYSSDRERKHAFIPHLISTHPSLSWRLVAHALYQMVKTVYGGADSCHRALDHLQQKFPTAEEARNQRLADGVRAMLGIVPTSTHSTEVKGTGELTSTSPSVTEASKQQQTTGAEVKDAGEATPTCSPVKDASKQQQTTGERPTLLELLRLKIPQSVGDNYSTFGIFLLNDETGSRVDAIEDAHRGNPERITRKILQEWLEGKGLPLTWESLVQTLRDTGLSTLADEIAAKKL